MSGRAKTSWLPRLLWCATLGTSAVLVLLVLLCPVLVNGVSAEDGWAQVAALFARDAAVRRTALASAAGLAVTAAVFFRPSRGPLTGPRPKPDRPRQDVAGA